MAFDKVTFNKVIRLHFQRSDTLHIFGSFLWFSTKWFLTKWVAPDNYTSNCKLFFPDCAQDCRHPRRFQASRNTCSCGSCSDGDVDSADPVRRDRRNRLDRRSDFGKRWKLAAAAADSQQSVGQPEDELFAETVTRRITGGRFGLGRCRRLSRGCSVSTKSLPHFGRTIGKNSKLSRQSR